MLPRRSKRLAVMKDLLDPPKNLAGIAVECAAVLTLMAIGYLISALGFTLWR
jgi:hypothetical protein